MEASKFKNMVVIKNLPSNIVEEAIVILKSNKKIKKLEKIEKGKLSEVETIKEKDNNYVIKEAEMLISNYINKIENKESKKQNKDINRKYKRLKNYAFITSLIIFLQAMILFAK